MAAKEAIDSPDSRDFSGNQRGRIFSRPDRSVSLTIDFFRRNLGYRKYSGIPILMYHGVGGTLHSGWHPYFETVTGLTTFQNHIRLLRTLGYRSVSLQTAFNWKRGNQERVVVITFDDGFEDFYRHAYPALTEAGFTAIVFLPTAFIGKNSIGIDNRRHLSWDQVREMSHARIEFGSHSIDHVELSKINPDELQRQIEESKMEIEQQISLEVTSFCHPYAFPEKNPEYINRLRLGLQQAGYRHGVTTRIGLSDERDDPLLRRRIPVNDYDDDCLLRAKLHGAYDWVYPLQRLHKQIKGFIR